MAAKMDAAFQFARTNTLTWSFITQFFPNFIYGLLSSNYSSCQYGFCLMNDTQDSKTDIPFPLQGIKQGPVSESPCSSFRITFSKKNFRNTIQVSKQFGSRSGPTFRTNILSVLIWVQTVYKDYQQTTKVAASKEGVIIHIVY